MKYQFDEKVACDVGVEEAIMLSNIEFWVEKNRANNRNYHNGRWWTYNSRVAFERLFPFWTEKQIRRILNNLIETNYIISSNFNKHKYDQTNWYTSVRDEFLEKLKNMAQPQQKGGKNGSTADWPKRSKELDQSGQPIPDSNSDTPVIQGGESPPGNTAENDSSKDDSGLPEEEKPIRKAPPTEEEEKAQNQQSDKKKKEAIFELFSKKYQPWMMFKQEKQAAIEMYNKQGVDQVRKAVNLMQENEEDPYCPQASSPNELAKKWGKLKRYKKKNDL